jgi:predicted alpha/beta superfamily hydrolase
MGELVLENITTYQMRSSIVGDDFTIYVLKTDGYDTSNGKLPVLYMTDGDWNMTVAMNNFRMLRQDYKTNEPLVVGIGYGKSDNKRVRDLDPNNGGPKFLEFIEKELMPFVERTYRTNDESALYGYSLGGMFATYVLFNRPDLFQKIYIGAPGNNGTTLMPAAREYFTKNKDLKSKVFIGVGGYEKEVVKNIDSFVNFISSKKLKDVEISSAITPDAGHGAALSGVMQNAIAFGYCEKHKRVAIDAALLKDYAAHYAYMENNDVVEQVDIFEKDGKLYARWGEPGAIADELAAISNTAFFNPANERMTYEFVGKDLILKVNGKQFKFVRK